MSEDNANSRGGFDLGAWTFQLLRTLATYQTLGHYVGDEEARRAYLDSLHENRWSLRSKAGLPPLQSEEDFCSLSKESVRVTVEEGVSKDVEEAFGTYERQILVVYASYLELMLGELVEALFIAYPERMHDYLAVGDEAENGGGGGRGRIGLRDVLAHKSMEDLLRNLAARSADYATRGTKKAVLKRVERISKYEMNAKVKSDVLALFDERNRIVHEGRQQPLPEAAVAQAHDVSERFLTELGRIAKTARIPYHDPANLVDPIPFDPNAEPPEYLDLE